MLFEHINDLHVIDVGLIKHKQLPIAASPDGFIIGLNRKRSAVHDWFKDYQIIEIKCPYTRKIVTTGTIKNIVPQYYYSQIQC